MIAVSRVQEGDPAGRKKLAVAAAAVVEKAVDGDLAAFKEIADRIDGRPMQAVDVTTRHEQSASELDEHELDRRIRELSVAAGKAAKGPKPATAH